MKQMKRIVLAMFVIAVVLSCFSVSALNTQAAGKTNTNVYDSKKGVCYPAKVRVGLDTKYTDNSTVYLLNEGDYVASVKSSSSDLVAKLTQKNVCTGAEYVTATIDGQESPRFKSSYKISCYTTKKGTYTLTVTIKNSKNKTVCKKKIKVFAEDYSTPVKSLKYAGKELYDYILTKKKSGKLQVSMNPGYKLQSVEVGTYVDGVYEEYDPEPVFKKVRNKSKITIATSSVYTRNAYSYDGSWYSYKSGTKCDYLYPVTVLRITYKDKKLGITRTQEYKIFYQNQ